MTVTRKRFAESPLATLGTRCIVRRSTSNLWVRVRRIFAAPKVSAFNRGSSGVGYRSGFTRVPENATLGCGPFHIGIGSLSRKLACEG